MRDSACSAFCERPRDKAGRRLRFSGHVPPEGRGHLGGPLSASSIGLINHTCTQRNLTAGAAGTCDAGGARASSNGYRPPPTS
eukprot:scaffold2175_cov381-Prasinococcus_capsulatus_cf.AAC.21